MAVHFWVGVKESGFPRIYLLGTREKQLLGTKMDVWHKHGVSLAITVVPNFQRIPLLKREKEQSETTIKE